MSYSRFHRRSARCYHWMPMKQNWSSWRRRSNGKRGNLVLTKKFLRVSLAHLIRFITWLQFNCTHIGIQGFLIIFVLKKYIAYAIIGFRVIWIESTGLFIGFYRLSVFSTLQEHMALVIIERSVIGSQFDSAFISFQRFLKAFQVTKSVSFAVIGSYIFWIELNGLIIGLTGV